MKISRLIILSIAMLAVASSSCNSDGGDGLEARPPQLTDLSTSTQSYDVLPGKLAIKIRSKALPANVSPDQIIISEVSPPASLLADAQVKKVYSTFKFEPENTILLEEATITVTLDSQPVGSVILARLNGNSIADVISQTILSSELVQSQSKITSPFKIRRFGVYSVIELKSVVNTCTGMLIASALNPNCKVGDECTTRIVTTGGSGNYSVEWGTNEASKIAGMNLSSNGTIRWTPNGVESRTIHLKITDNGCPNQVLSDYVTEIRSYDDVDPIIPEIANVKASTERYQGTLFPSEGAQLLPPKSAPTKRVTISIAFSTDKMDRSSVEAAFSLTDPTGNAIAGEKSWDGTGAVFLFKASELKASTIYTVKLANTAKIKEGLSLAPFEGSLTTMTPGDFDGDGIPDLVIGAPGTDANSGAINIFSGRAINDGKTLPAVVINNKNSLGFIVSTASDLDNDGLTDIIAGGDGIPSCEDIKLFIFKSSEIKTKMSEASLSGITQTIPFSSSLVESAIGAKGDRMPWCVKSIANLGDLNGNGYDDIAIGAIGDVIPRTNFKEPGAVYFYDGSTLINPNTIAGDYIVNSSKAFATVGEAANGNELGISIANAGDLNSDTKAEILIGAPKSGSNSTGKVFIFRYQDLILEANTITPTENAYISIVGEDNTQMGSVVRSGGLISADKIPSILTRSIQPDRIMLFDGRNLTQQGQVLPNRAARLPAPAGASDFGYDILSLGDIDGDKLEDIVVGAPSTQINGSTTGNAFLVYSRTGRILPLVEQNNPLIGRFGFPIAKLGDIDGDGKADFAIAAPRSSNNKGYVYIYRTKDMVNVIKLEGRTEGDYFGWSLDSLGR